MPTFSGPPPSTKHIPHALLGMSRKQQRKTDLAGKTDFPKHQSHEADRGIGEGAGRGGGAAEAWGSGAVGAAGRLRTRDWQWQRQRQVLEGRGDDGFPANASVDRGQLMARCLLTDTGRGETIPATTPKLSNQERRGL